MKSKKYPVALLINDVHLNKDNGDLVKDIFQQAIKICKEKSISTIILGGDVFTNRSGQPLICLTIWLEILSMIADAHLMLVVIPGNHDKTDANSENSYLDVFRYHPNIRVVSKHEIIRYNGDLIIGLIPYFGDERWLEEFKELELKVGRADHHILITHMGVEGVRNNDGTEVVSVIKPKTFKNWDKVLVGHYHNASKVGDNIYYTGSAYQNDFGENIVDKGATIIYSDASLKFIPFDFPKHIKEVLYVTDTESLRNVIEKYSDGNEMYDNIRLVFRGKKVDLKKVDTAELQRLGFEVTFESTESVEAVELAECEEIISMDKKSIFKDFLKFCSENDIKGKHLQYGMKLMKTL